MTTTGIVRFTAAKINDVNDPLIGQSVSGGQEYTGQLGAFMTLNADEALKRSNTSKATLYAGKYQYVQLYGTLTQAAKLGIPVFWRDPDAFVVTTDHLTGNGSFAGVLLNGSQTAGNYGWILVEGKAVVQAIASLSNGSAAAGDTVSVKAGTDGGFDDAASANANTLRDHLIVGEWIDVPTNNNTGKAWIYRKNADGL